MDALITYGLYGVAFLLILVGVAGTIVPALPGIPMIFAGAWLIGYMEDYQYFGWGTLIALGVLTVISLIIDWVSQTMGAQKAGATKLGLSGAFLGTIIGIPFGLQTLKLGMLALWPFGSQVTDNGNSGGCLSVIMNVIWICIGGFWICLTHLFFGLLLCITLIGIPFGRQHFKMAALALTPFGKSIS